MVRRPPPADLDELVARARALRGRTLADVAGELGVRVADDSVRTKGKLGQLVEQALGATGGSTATRDFPELETELKTIPVDAAGAPRESTYVCTLQLMDADRAEWESSWVRAKLARVLWVPIVSESRESPWGVRTLGAPLLWSPSAEQDDGLRADFEDIVGAIGAGRVEAVDARVGRWLQLRPKARDGAARTAAWAGDEGVVATVPRGFYLRARFTAAILADPRAVP